MASSSGSRVVPLVDFPRTAGLPAIRVDHWVRAGPHPSQRGTHAHDFLALFYLERGDQVLRVDGRDVALGAGDAFVVAPGAVVTPRAGPDVDAEETTGWMVFFPADAVDPSAAAPLVSWRTHPLLSPFVGNHRGGAQCLHIPPDERASWLGHLAGLDAELRGRLDGYADAARAHLTLLLVHLGRLHWDAPAERGIEPLLAAVFDVIEARSHEPISLRDVAAAVGLTTGHLTTVVGRRTGRTVQQWITERRMREARRLLADTDLAVGEIARRVGYREAGYFVRRFRAEHGVPPAAWRRAGRPGGEPV
jgi:AraC family transcriptional activator of pobA